MNAPHGSPLGFERGCRSKGGCANHSSPDMLTCVEAVIARRRDFSLHRLPKHQPLPRGNGAPAHSSSERSTAERPTEVHGTVWGYRRGCHQSTDCPNWRTGHLTCNEARRRYVERYRDRRMSGIGAPVLHGTSRGYLTGCQDRSACPGDEAGLTCPDARAEYKRRLRSPTSASPVLVDATAAARRIHLLTRAGFSLRQIAERAGVGRSTVCRIVGRASPKVFITNEVNVKILRAAEG